MQYSIQAPSHVETTIKLPASKSISNRAAIIYALSKGAPEPRNLSDCDDTRVIVEALRHRPEVIDIGAAGTSMRFMTAYLAITSGEHTLTGTERMKHRPIGVLVDALRSMGAEISYKGQEGYPPLHIKGHPLDGGHVEMAGGVSSQYISAMLLIGPALKNGLELKLTGSIVSRPYIDLTLCTMREYGADVEWTDVDTITVKPKPYTPMEYAIENDWSASSYWYEILALLDDYESKIHLPGLIDGSRQGDSVVRYIFSLMGVKTAFTGRSAKGAADVTLTRHMRTLPRLDYDFINSPDLAQTFVVTCIGLGIPFHFTGLTSLRIKETDRIQALKTELRKLGFVIQVGDNDDIVWNGVKCEPSMEPIDTYKDHRMAMAFAPLAIKFPQLKINDPMVVTKSYPHYWDDLRQAGFVITQTE